MTRFGLKLVVAAMLLAPHFAATAAEEPGALAATAPDAAPSADREERSAPEGRILNGHVFMPANAVPGALVTTSFASQLLLGVGQTSGTFQVGDRIFSGTYQYAGVGSSLGYEHAFLDSFSVRLAINEVIYSGINGDSAIAVGTKVQLGGTLGATASLPAGESLRLALLFDVGYVPGLAITIGSGLRTIIDACRQGACLPDAGAIFGTNNALTIQPAFAASWAPLRSLGVVANFSYLYVSQDQNSGTFTGSALGLATAVDYDFKANSAVPIGLMVQWSWTVPISGSGLQHVTDLGGGIFYTGTEHLALGLQLISRRFAVDPGLAVSWSTFLANVGMRYYW